MAGIESILNRADFFLLILARISGFVMLMPVFSNRLLLNQAKVIIIIVLSILLFPILNVQPVPYPADDGFYIAALLGELALGLALGTITQLIFAAVQTAGQFIDMQMGLGMANVMDPLYGQQIPLTANFMQILAMLLFLGVNGHHLMIEALVKSYQWIPIFTPSLATPWIGAKVEMFVLFFSGMFLTALKLSLPVIGALLITDFSLGIVSRTVPQMNVFVIGFIVKIFLGFLIMALVMPFYMEALQGLFVLNLEDLVKFMGSGR